VITADQPAGPGLRIDRRRLLWIHLEPLENPRLRVMAELARQWTDG
jgi:hypothetical protein